jgi:hypothetical protein
MPPALKEAAVISAVLLLIVGMSLLLGLRFPY